MAVQQTPSSSPASLRRHILWLLVAVVGMFAAGIGLSLWFSFKTNEANQQQLLEQQAEQARVSMRRRLDYYRALIDNLARDPDLEDLMRVGGHEDFQRWAMARQRLLPELRGLALVSPQGEVLGDAGQLRVGPQCRHDLSRAGDRMTRQSLLHREATGDGHADIVSSVHGVDGTVLGSVFMSVRLAQFQRVVNDSTRHGQVLKLVDANGATIVRHGTIRGAAREVRLALPEVGWTLVAQAPQQRLTREGMLQVVAGLLTLGAVLLLLGGSLLRLRRTMLHDIGATRDALTALARSDEVPVLVPYYAEFEPAVADINLIAQQLQDQRARLAHLSLTDPLTGLPNRRAFENHFSQALGMAERQHPVALVLLDIDRFKGVNDRFGHGVGDQVLLALAQSLKSLTRRADLSARFAGDEFVALLADLDAAGVQAWYARLSDRFRGELNALGLDLQTGLSAGQTWLGSVPRDNLNEALARADRALYEAKAQGRGRLVLDAGAGDERAG